MKGKHNSPTRIYRESSLHQFVDGSHGVEDDHGVAHEIERDYIGICKRCSKPSVNSRMWTHHICATSPCTQAIPSTVGDCRYYQQTEDQAAQEVTAKISSCDHTCDMRGTNQQMRRQGWQFACARKPCCFAGEPEPRRPKYPGRHSSWFPLESSRQIRSKAR